LNRAIDVFADWMGLDGPVLMGKLRISSVRGKDVYAFTFDPQWLDKQRQTLLLDPDLKWGHGEQFSGEGFGMFLDSAPDRWGRTLIARREAWEARMAGRAPRHLVDSDFLLAVEDRTRMGGLRFRDPETGNFLSIHPQQQIPPLRLLRELESASCLVDAEAPDDASLDAGLRILLWPGSSLGGARPKANTLDPEGNLWIAKFPRRSDEVDVGAWEGITQELARQAGLRVPAVRVDTFSRHGHTFLVKRFDRVGDQRVHYASAMTLLGYRDGDGAAQGAGYLDLAELICRYGENVAADLRELWSRIAFSVAVGNADDHLRNHGFLLGKRGWRLSPLFDVNPQPGATHLSLNITENDNRMDFELVREVAPFFRLDQSSADGILSHLRDVVSRWQSHARRYASTSADIDRMRSAFQEEKP
jgi:serine/threonine-protein kinase HipA